MILEGLCEHGRLTTAYCGDCALLAEILQPNKQIDWKKHEEKRKEVLEDPLEAYYVPSHTGGSSDYYDLPPDCTTLQDVIVKQDMHWSQANIFKAAYRWDKKPDLEYNLRKIIWFANDALSRIERSKDAGPKDAIMKDQSGQ